MPCAGIILRWMAGRCTATGISGSPLLESTLNSHELTAICRVRDPCWKVEDKAVHTYCWKDILLDILLVEEWCFVNFHKNVSRIFWWFFLFKMNFFVILIQFKFVWKEIDSYFHQYFSNEKFDRYMHIFIGHINISINSLSI